MSGVTRIYFLFPIKCKFRFRSTLARSLQLVRWIEPWTYRTKVKVWSASVYVIIYNLENSVLLHKTVLPCNILKIHKITETSVYFINFESLLLKRCNKYLWSKESPATHWYLHLCTKSIFYLLKYALFCEMHKLLGKQRYKNP